MTQDYAPTAGLDDDPERSAILPPELASPEDFYAARVAGWALGGFLRFAGQARSRSARHVLFRAACGGDYREEHLEAWSTTDRCGDADTVDRVRACDRKLLLALAGLVATQQLDESDRARAINLYRLVEAAHGAEAFSRIDRHLYLELLVEAEAADRFAEAFWESPPEGAEWAQSVLFAANLCNPWTAADERQSGPEWHRLVNSLYANAGLEDLEILDAGRAPFDSILCSADTVVEGGPLVTVLVPTHDPSERLGTALSSLVSQSWTNVEILVLDDGSSPGFRYRIDAWAERDPRVVVLRMPSNIGNYAARNIGLDESSGEFVTVHDDDDWSHPRKIEVQVRNLIANPGTSANMSQLVRATSQLSFTRINSNFRWIQPNYSSLMYRRDVFDSIGYWDEVTRSGDAEFRNRLVAATGKAPTVVGGAPLSFLRVRSGSLTQGEIQRAHIHPRRRWYDLASRGWHSETSRAGKALTLPRNARPGAPFSAPVGMVPGDPHHLDVDVVYATDFRFPGGNSSISVNEIELLLSQGKSVAMLQLDSPVLVGTTELHARAAAVSLSPGCQVVTTSTSITAKAVIVRHPTVLQFAERTRSGVRADRHVLIVNHAPALRDGTEAHYEINACVAAYRDIFGAEPLVASESGVVRRCLEGRITTPMTSFDWSGSLPGTSEPPRRSADPSRPPVLGRHSRDNREKWPTDPSAIAEVYPVEGWDVRILGGAQIPAERLGESPPGWTVYEFGSRAPGDFLEEIDFWVYFHEENLIESFGMATLEAMAAGLVVILPPYMEATFGEGAVYCEMNEVQRMVDWYWARPAEYERQGRMAHRVTQERFAVESFERRIAALVT